MIATAPHQLVTLQETDHVYHVDGAYKPGVSEILSSVGVRAKRGAWRSISGSEFMSEHETARDFGRAFHVYPKLRLSGVPRASIEIDPEMAPWVDQWERFREERLVGAELVLLDSTPILERSLYCPSLGYCGTIDAAVVMGGKHLLLDWKTGTLTGAHGLQLGAYVRLAEEVTHEYGWEAWIVQIRDDGYRVDFIRGASLRLCMNNWVSVVNVYKM